MEVKHISHNNGIEFGELLAEAYEMRWRVVSHSVSMNQYNNIFSAVLERSIL